MSISPELIQKVVRETVQEVVARRAGAASPCGDGIFADMNDAVEAADRAWSRYLDCSMRDRRCYVQVIRDVCSEESALRHMAEAAVEETGMGNAHDKFLKNRYAALDTPGTEDIVTEAWSGDDGLTTIEFSPFGVIGAITPTTNPTETVINNSIGMLAAGNAVVFSPHPRATGITHWLIRRINKALAEVGAPADLITTVESPSIENTNAMMAHPKVRMLVATGGPGIVRSVLSSGKKAIGAGAGNPPAVVDATADIPQAAKDIVDGASFDNNLPCTAEKEVIAVDSIVDLLKFEMLKHGAVEIRDRAVVDRLASFVAEDGRAVPKWVGRPAAVLAAEAGLTVPEDTRLLIAEVPFEHTFVQTELMMPILGVVRVKNIDEAIDRAVEAEHGNRHTAVMHSLDVKALTKMGKRIQTTIFVKNGPSYNGIGIGGEGYPTFTIAGPTGEGLTSARNFARRRRCVLKGGLSVR
ncbi:aldehyde dehydrogenase family protein [uncultured Propionibacterium sp.]|uniref:aldehyde dehydrogenase family protein n=1 Tax=uncultured Propionibacterium sp. TaxID=218066 RepID=UPI002930AF7F|nr:aldehyde dehydrogenase family protein [uncultured Propionibacterium sp.]